MTSLKKLLRKILVPPEQNKTVYLIILFFSFFGFIDAAYLSVSYYLGEAPNCYLFNGCDIVTTSSYSKILGVPISLFGAFYYLFIFFASLAIILHNKTTFTKYIFGVSSFGFAVSIFLTYVQFFVLQALCIYCLSSAIFTLIIFILSMFLVIFYAK